MKSQKFLTLIFLLFFFFNTKVQAVEKCYECADLPCETLREQKCSQISWPVLEDGEVTYKVYPNFTGVYNCISLFGKKNNTTQIKKFKGCIAEFRIKDTIKEIEGSGFRHSVCNTDLCNLDRKCLDCRDLYCSKPRRLTCPSEDFSCIAAQGTINGKTVKNKQCISKNKAKAECVRHQKMGSHCYFCNSDYCNEKTVVLKNSKYIEEDTGETLYFSLLMMIMMVVLLSLFK